MNAVKRMLRNLNFGYFFRNYLFAIIVASLFLAIPTQTETSWLIYLFMIANVLLYPFATAVWDNLRDLLKGDFQLWVSGYLLLFTLILKLSIKLTLFFGAIPIGILGFLLLLFLTRNAE